jgi:hypothetical protein
MTTQSDPPEKPQFLVRPAKIGGHWSVLYRPPRGIGEEIFGFDTQQEAQDWIADDSEQWLKDKEAKARRLGD